MSIGKFFILVILGIVLVHHTAFGRSASTTNYFSPTVYQWQLTGEGDWQTPGNWAPPRTAAAPDDILIFNVGSTVTVSNVPTQTIGQLILFGTTRVDLNSTGAIVLTIGGAGGDDLVVTAGSALNLNGADPINLSILAGATAKINGSMAFSSPGAAPHRLAAIDAGSVVFEAGSVFSALDGFVGNPFGTANLNSVIFENGSNYIAVAGADPFGAAEPDSVVVFRKGSLFSLRSGGMPSFSGRTYGNFELNSPGRDVWATGTSPLVLDDVTLIAGRLYLNLSGDPGHSIRGNITLMSGSRLAFSSGTVRLNGTGTQTFTGASAAQQADGGSTIVIDNPNGLNLNYPFAAWNLALINGRVNTGEAYLAVGGNLFRTNGYVNGYLTRYFFAPGPYMFEVGTENAYAPVRADITAGTWPAGLTVKTSGTAEPNILNPAKALSRYWQISGTSGTTADLTFNYLDGDIPTTANESNFIIQRYDGGFTQPSGVIDTAANTFRVNGLTSFAQDWTLAEPSALLPSRTVFDYDGDGRSDLSVFRPSVGEWYYQQSSTNITRGFGFGTSTDKVATADFTGDGKTDIAFWRPSTGEWYVLRSEDSSFYAFPFGASGDIPEPADYDGDGKADAAVYRPSAQTWFILKSTGGVLSVPFGLANDIPVPADYDGDGKADVSIYRPSLGQWWYLRSSNGSVFAATFGSPTDKPVAGDYTGDGKADVAFYRPSNGSWYILRSEDFTYYAFPFGNSTDKPAPADYDGDGKFDAAVFRPSDTNWYILKSTGGLYIQQYGAANDIPLPGGFVP